MKKAVNPDLLTKQYKQKSHLTKAMNTANQE